MSSVKIEGHSNLVRDAQTSAILNNDNESLRIYKQRRITMRKQSQDFDKMKNEIDDIKSDINDIKNLLLDMVKKD